MICADAVSSTLLASVPGLMTARFSIHRNKPFKSLPDAIQDRTGLSSWNERN